MQAATKYKINYSSAKALYKKMKDEGINPGDIQDVEQQADHDLDERRRCGFIEVMEGQPEKHFNTIN